LPQFRRSTLHNDANDYNLLVDNGRFALLDFGDMVHSCTVFDLAIGLAYTLLPSQNLLADAVIIHRAYQAISPLTAVERQHLYTLIALRWCTSVAIAAHQMAQEPDNAYLAISQDGAWAALAQWRTIEPAAYQQTFVR
jgi:Ser/Thr protein kinase RdoA (MazF antagonist)